MSPTDPAVARDLLGAQLTGEKLTTRWRLSAGDVRTELTLAMQLRQKSLVERKMRPMSRPQCDLRPFSPCGTGSPLPLSHSSATETAMPRSQIGRAHV